MIGLITRKLKMQNKIIFTTPLDGLIEHKDLHPQPAKNFTPDWYKKLPSDLKGNNKFVSKVIPNMKTVKMCPSFSEIFKEGFIILAPCDIYLRVEDNGEWQWATPDSEIRLDIHEDEQFTQHINNKIKKVFKLISPWYAITPKGWSLRQIPIIYDFNEDWQVAYGIVNTDVTHELNQQILYTSSSNEVLIKRGTPLNYLVPFKRNKIPGYSVEKYNDKLHTTIQKGQRLVASSFKSVGPYYRNS